MREWIGILAAVVLGAVTVALGDGGGDAKTARVGVVLPAGLSTPDGMTIDAQNNIILSVPCLNNRGHAGCLMKITPDDKLEEYFTPPPHPRTKATFPLGNVFASDGNLYVADCQAIAGNEEYESRILKITVKDGKPTACEAVVDGLVFANGLACWGDKIYVTETKFEPNPAKDKPMPSGVYAFSFAEMSSGKPIVVKRGGTDPHLVFSFTTKNETWRVGANGIGFGPDGTLYVCNFGDKQLLAATLGSDGKATSSRVVAEGGPMLCTDGLKVDGKTGLVYIADFLGSAVHRVDPKTGTITTIAKSGPSDGKAGQLKKCSEVCLRGGKIYVSNINLALDGNEPGDFYGVSVIEMEGK